MKHNSTDKMDLAQAVHLSLQGIKKLWDEGDRMVSVKRLFPSMYAIFTSFLGSFVSCRIIWVLTQVFSKILVMIFSL